MALSFCSICGSLVWDYGDAHKCHPIFMVSLYDPRDEGIDSGEQWRGETAQDAAEHYAIFVAAADNQEVYVWAMEEKWVEKFIVTVRYEPSVEVHGGEKFKL